MEQIHAPNKMVARILGKQVPEDGLLYRLSRFVIVDGDMMYNTLTGEAVFMADERTQIERWFRVPHDMDETVLAYSVRQKWLQGAGPGTNGKQKYIVFMTTNCNASCFYCYEKGLKSMTMTEQTARDVASYIISRSNKDVPPRIRWFGGEPLVNLQAINTISQTLNANGFKFTSEIFTNGELLPSISTETLRDSWHLVKIQLTVDDVGAEYARAKGLPDGAFDRLCASIDRLSTAGIQIHIRIHYHPGKGTDAPMRVARLFCGMQNVAPYCVMLYNGGTEEDYTGMFEVEKYISEHGGHKIRFPVVRFGSSCMADNRKAACITTDGHLSPCEHYPYGENYGSIYGGEYDRAILRRWSAKTRNFCKRCVLYPSCGKPALCPANGKCSPAEVEHEIKRVKYALRGGNK